MPVELKVIEGGLLPRADTTNEYLVCFLRQTLGDDRMSFEQMLELTDWERDSTWVSDVAKLAREMGLLR